MSIKLILLGLVLALCIVAVSTNYWETFGINLENVEHDGTDVKITVKGHMGLWKVCTNNEQKMVKGGKVMSDNKSKSCDKLLSGLNKKETDIFKACRVLSILICVFVVLVIVAEYFDYPRISLLISGLAVFMGMFPVLLYDYGAKNRMKSATKGSKNVKIDTFISYFCKDFL